MYAKASPLSLIPLPIKTSLPCASSSIKPVSVFIFVSVCLSRKTNALLKGPLTAVPVRDAIALVMSIWLGPEPRSLKSVPDGKSAFTLPSPLHPETSIKIDTCKNLIFAFTCVLSDAVFVKSKESFTFRKS